MSAQTAPAFRAQHSALLLVDLQNDFLHPSGAYARGGVSCAAAAALPARLAPVAEAARFAGAWIFSTHFTLVPGRGGAPLISPHLAKLRPFLGPGDFAPGSEGQALVRELRPADFSVEKIAYSAFYMSRLEWLLHRCGCETLLIAGLTTNGGVASTLRDAHVRGFECRLLADGCAAFSERAHKTALADLASLCQLTTCAETAAGLRAQKD